MIRYVGSCFIFFCDSSLGRGSVTEVSADVDSADVISTRASLHDRGD